MFYMLPSNFGTFLMACRMIALSTSESGEARSDLTVLYRPSEVFRGCCPIFVISDNYADAGRETF